MKKGKKAKLIIKKSRGTRTAYMFQNNASTFDLANTGSLAFQKISYKDENLSDYFCNEYCDIVSITDLVCLKCITDVR